MGEEGKSVTLEEAVGSSDVDPEKPKVFSCQFCDKKFFIRHALAGHQNAHWREKSEAKRTKRKREEPTLSASPYAFMLSQNRDVMGPSHHICYSHSRNHGAYQSWYHHPYQLSNRFELGATHSRLNIPVRRPSTGIGEGHANVGANFFMSQRHYRDKITETSEFFSVGSSKKGIPFVENDHNVADSSGNDKKLDLSLHL